MNNAAQMKKAVEIMNDNTATVSYENHGLSINFMYAPARKSEIEVKAEELRKAFPIVVVKGRKWTRIEIING